MYFTRRAAADGCAAILITNASPAMAPWGGREKRLGTNPWSIAATYGDKVVAVDIANTAVARGKIYLARQKGEPISDSWALTPEGARTTDAAKAVHGVILPMAEHKGYAITFMMDILSGALTGSAVGTQVHGLYEAPVWCETDRLCATRRGSGQTWAVDVRRQALPGEPCVRLALSMAVTNREVGDVLASTLVAPVLGLGAFLAWGGLWAVGVPLLVATTGSAIWYSRRKARREADEAIARAAEYEAGEHGQADDTLQ